MPKLRLKNPRKQLQIRLEDVLLEWIDMQAYRAGVARSTMIRDLLVQARGQHESVERLQDDIRELRDQVHRLVEIEEHRGI